MVDGTTQAEPGVQMQEQMTEPAEKMLSQSEVNALIGREKSQMRAKIEQELARSNANMGGMSAPQVDMDAIIREASERASQALADRFAKEQEAQLQQQRESMMRDIASKYHDKVSAAKPNYSDFDDVMADFDISSFPKLAVLVSDLENGGDVIYNLAKNPQKIGSIYQLAEQSPAMAKRALQQMVDSIKMNQQAMAENVSANAPLSRMNPSAKTGVNASEPRSVADFKQQSWLRR